MLAVIAHPDKQRKCQEELDAVVGRSRMPTFADRDSLPYLCATVREALRWRPVTPVGEFCIMMNECIFNVSWDRNTTPNDPGKLRTTLDAFDASCF